MSIKKRIPFRKMKFILFQIYLIDMRKVFSLKQKGKYSKDNVCFDEVITIKTK